MKCVRKGLKRKNAEFSSDSTQVMKDTSETQHNKPASKTGKRSKSEDSLNNKKTGVDIKPDLEGNTSATHNSCSGLKKSPEQRLDFKFFDVSCDKLARSLLGKKVVSLVDGKRVSGIIVETEAYLGPVDKAAHSYNGKRTAKNEAMFMAPGTAYVYNIYGTYCCLNISSQGDGAAVLLRALEPKENLELMNTFRAKDSSDTSFLKKDGRALCNGPSKLCQALNIKKETVNKINLCTSNSVWLENGESIDDNDVVSCKRINIDYAEDWIDKPLRFYIHENAFVSIKDKLAMKKLDK